MLFTCPHGCGHSHNTYGNLGKGGGGITDNKVRENGKEDELTWSVEAEEKNYRTHQT
jgi:hypothetical protein